jgi:hypothetical protein
MSQEKFPKPGEYWHRADGSPDGVTILSVDSHPTDPWIEYRYDSGMVIEKNWGGFKARFYFKENP